MTGTEIRSIPHRDLHDGGTCLIDRGLQTAYDILQFFSDRQVLGAVLFAFAAFDAEGGVGPVLPHCRGHHIFHQSRPVFLSIAVIISRETDRCCNSQCLQVFVFHESNPLSPAGGILYGSPVLSKHST